MNSIDNCYKKSVKICVIRDMLDFNKMEKKNEKMDR